MVDSTYEVWTNAVREAADIVEVIGRSVSLKQKGKKFWGLCPFHQEKTPSFSVDSHQQLFYCFGCHKGGTVFTFLMEHDGLTFIEAVDMLAAEVGIPRGEREDKSDFHRHFSRLQAVMEWSQEFFQLSTNQYHDIFGQYLESRQIRPEAQKQFELGYAPKSWNALSQFLSRHGVSEAEMIEAGVVTARKEGNGVMTVGGNGLCFPSGIIVDSLLALADGRSKPTRNRNILTPRKRRYFIRAACFTENIQRVNFGARANGHY